MVVLFRDFQFDDLQQEQGFQAKLMRSAIQLCFWWFFLSGVLICAACMLVILRFSDKIPLAVTISNFSPAVVMFLAASAIRFNPLCQQHVLLGIAVAMLTMVGWSGWFLHQVVEIDSLDARARLHDVFTLVEGHTSAEANLLSYIKQVSSSKVIWPFVVFSQFHLDFLRCFPFTKVLIMVYLSLPVMLAATTALSPAITLHTYAAVIGSAVTALYASATAIYITVLRRREFRADHELQQSLANEAKAMEELARREVAHKENAQEADSILNHSLKNMMADAAGCIHLYLQALPGPHPVDLAQALTCLDRGMGWCRKRQALLRVTAGRYVPMLMTINLRELGDALVRGRNVRCSFVDADVLLDTLLTELVFDNALNNAFRHGHLENPNVHFSITMVHAQTGVDNVFTATFEVRNRSCPEKPQVTPDLVCRALSGEGCYSAGASSLSEHLGLQHMFMAAQACGMDLTLEQEGDVVVLRGLLTVQAVRSPPSLTDRSEEHVSLPAGVRIFCVDDSAVARRLLYHAFANHPSHPRVYVFGATADEVEEFVHSSLQSADIVILDHHLNYGLVQYFGPKLLERLLQNGYSGMACIRSANVIAGHEWEYTDVGAHCAIGKDVSPRDLVDTVARAYLHFQPLASDPVQSSTVSQSLLSNSNPSEDSFSSLVGGRFPGSQAAQRDRQALTPANCPYATLC